MEQQGMQAPKETQPGNDLLSSRQLTGLEGQHSGPSETHRSPLRLFIITIVTIFMAEVVAMIAVYFIEPLPYYVTTFIDAGIMIILIFPVLYYFSFRPLISQMEKSWEAEESLLRSRELQEKFFDSINTHIAYMDRAFNFIRVNNAYANANEREPEYFVGKNHFALFPHPENQAIFQRVVESGEAYSAHEKAFEYAEHPERGITYWDWNLQPVKDFKGNVAGLVLSLLDVTERRRAQDAIHQLSRIVEQTEDSVVVTNRDGIIEYVNPAFERRTGYTQAEMVGQTPKVLKSGLHQKDFYAALWTTILQGEVFQSEIANRKKNGDLFYEVKTITPLRDTQGNITHFVATGKDITTHKQDEEELRKAYEELEARVEERTEELRIVNNDLQAEINMRRQTEEALRQSESGLKRAQEIAHLGSWELDLINDKLTWSDEVYRIFGLAPQEFRASYEAFLEVVHPDDRGAVDDAYSGSVRDGKDGYEIEHRIIRASSGEIRIVHEKCEHFRNESGQIIRSGGMVHDITERKQAEEALRRSEAILLQTGQMAKVGGWELDLQTMALYWSAETYRIHEIDPSAPISLEGAIDFYTSEARPTILAAVQRAMNDSTSYDLELPMVTAKGRSLWIRTKGEAEFRDGKCVRLFGTFQDITQRKQAERRLAYLASFPERNPNPVIEVDFEGRVHYMNPAASQILPDLAERGLDHPWLAELDRIVSVFHDHQVVGASYDVVLGKRFYQQLLFVLAEERLVRIYGTDITERKQAEQALREAHDELELRVQKRTEELAIANKKLVREIAEREVIERQLRLQTAAMEAAANGIVITDCEGNIQWTNPALSRMSGYEARDLVGQNMNIFQSGRQDETYYNKMWTTILSGQVWQSEIINQRKDGHDYVEEQTITPVLDNQGRITQFIAIKQDITDRKAAEKDLRERTQKEKILTETIHTMQLDIARDLHDTIGQNISFLRMKLDYLSEKKIRKQSEMQLELQNMARAANESYDLIRGTLAVLQSSDSNDLFRVFTRYAEQIEERSSFKIVLSSQGEPRFMSAKRMRHLFYAFREVLNNIEKHARASQVTIEMVWNQDCLNLVVCDNGVGFELEKVQYGRRYGLRFMRERVELLNGSLRMRSSLGSGTSITLQVPYE